MANKDDEAFPTTILVLLLTADVIPEVCVFVLLLTWLVIDDDALCTSASVASEPPVILALVSERTPV